MIRRSYLSSDRGYKLVSFFVAVSIWFVMVGKKDSVLVKELNVVFVTEKGLSVSKSSSDRVQVKLEGPKVSLLKLRSMTDSLVIDVKKYEKGSHRVKVPKDSLSLPVGVNISEVRPQGLWIKVEAPPDMKELINEL